MRKASLLLALAISAVSVLGGTAAARKTVRVSDSVSVAFSQPKSYGGTVGGFSPARFAGVCAPGRKVVLNFRDAPNQSVTQIGTDRTDAAGNWVVEAQKRLHGQVQAVAKKRVVHRGGK